MLKLRCFKRMLSSTSKRSSHVCIVGAGPAGFYAAMHLSKHLSAVKIDMFDKLPTPFGLIRYGVAPDHPEVKNVINQFTKVAQQANVNFNGNVVLGRDIYLHELRRHYDAVLLTYGAENDKVIGIENEDSKNVIAARAFVGWYNGLPSDKDLEIDLSASTAAILGQGNVALDVARILLTPVDDLRKTDITEHALSQLANSKVREVYLVGRRGPLQVAFTIKELREQIKLPNCKTIWRESDFAGVQELVGNLPRPRKRLTELMLKSLNESCIEDHNCKKYFKPIFLRSPNKFLVDDQRRLTGIELICNKLKGDNFENQTCVQTNEKEILNCSLAFRSIGYQSISVDKDLVFAPNGCIANENGRVMEGASEGLGNVYVGGWLGTGPVGVILHTMGNSFHVAKSICEDILKNEGKIDSKGGFEEIRKIIKHNEIVDWKGWEKINEYEIEQGKKYGKPREKICSIQKMLEIALSS